MKKYCLSYYYNIEEKEIFSSLVTEVDFLVNRTDGCSFLSTKLPAEIEYFETEGAMFNALREASCTENYDTGSKLHFINVTLGAVEEMNEDDEDEIDYIDYYYCVDGKIYKL